MTKRIVDTKAIDDFTRRLGMLPSIVRDTIDDTNRRSATAMAKRGRQIAPRSEHGPHIADTIKVEAGDPRLMEQVVSIGSTPLFYAIPLEFGHVAADGSHVPANPFWVPLTKIFRKRHRTALRRAMRKALKEVLAI
ncbi:hypothetical protein [Novosphingobium sp.]|jgi:hypothetical protein|uniref:hypothetical protein n=1 Tax=Novosphingobium sp. TaxID=1874826 RepID=UPI002FE0DEEE